MIKDMVVEDVYCIRPIAAYGKEPDATEQILDLHEVPGSVLRTLFSVRGEVLAIFGGLVTNRTMSVIAYADQLIYKYPVKYHKGIKGQIDSLFKEFKLLRMQSSIFVDNKEAIKQHKSWGFEFEGTMRKSGPNGEDQHLMARVV